MRPTDTNGKSAGWHFFWKSVGLTVAAVALIAVGFFGAMAVTGAFA